MPPENTRRTTARENLHPQWYIRAIIYMVAILHTRHRVTFRASALILIGLGFIFSALAGDLIGAVAIPRTLTTIFARLDIKDGFVVHPICFRCHRVFDVDVGPSTFCPDCNEEIFGTANQDEFNGWEDRDIDSGSDDASASGRSKKRNPHVVAPIQLLSTALRNFFKRREMISAVTSWKKRPRNHRDFQCMQDGDVWNTIKGPDGDPFFSRSEHEKEIRLGVSLSLDWCVCSLLASNYLKFCVGLAAKKAVLGQAILQECYPFVSKI